MGSEEMGGTWRATLFRDQGVYFILPFGYKSLFSSGKFSAVEHEGLNAIGFWWTIKQDAKNVEIMCFPFLYTSDLVSC